MSWNYRVLRFTTNMPEEPFYLEIKEVYYDDDNKANGYCDTCVMSETLEGLTWTLDRMKEALDKPILDATDIYKE